MVELSAGWLFDVDCDGDGVPDGCRIAADPSLDANGDGILDSCQYARGDFNLDGVVDGADLSVLLRGGDRRTASSATLPATALWMAPIWRCCLATGACRRVRGER